MIIIQVQKYTNPHLNVTTEFKALLLALLKYTNTDKKTKRQKDKNTKRQKDKKTKREEKNKKNKKTKRPRIKRQTPTFQDV